MKLHMPGHHWDPKSIKWKPPYFFSFRFDWLIERQGKWAEPDYQGVTYPPFACGAGNVLSADLVHWLAGNAGSLKRYQVLVSLKGFSLLNSWWDNSRRSLGDTEFASHFRVRMSRWVFGYLPLDLHCIRLYIRNRIRNKRGCNVIGWWWRQCLSSANHVALLCICASHFAW